jgi:predicted ATPase
MELLRTEGIRVLTLTGPGGIGKTRLALEAARRMAPEIAYGATVVDLSSLRDPELVLPAIADVLGAGDDVAGHIGSRHVLLLLDNLEQVGGAAPALAALIAACPNLSVLATSRVPLHIAAEQEFAVPSLTETESIDLFTSRARAIDRQFVADDAVAEICRRLDGLPLAIELAAARVRLMPPAELLLRLGQRLPLLIGGPLERPDRQRTLSAAIAWSYELLAPDQQALFQRLHVFAGGWTLEAAEAIAMSDLGSLEALVDHSLVRVADGRFSLLETIREFATDRSAADPGAVADLRERHAAYYLGLAESPAMNLQATSGHGTTFEVEQDNFREALRFLIGHDHGNRPIRMTEALWQHWISRGQLDEGETWIREALASSQDADLVFRGNALSCLGEFPRFRGESAKAIAIKLEGLELLRQVGYEPGIAATLYDLGSLAIGIRDFALARIYLDEAVAVRERLGDPMGIAHAVGGLAELEIAEGDAAGATATLAQLIESGRTHGWATQNGAFFANFLASYGDGLQRLGRIPEARIALREAMETIEPWNMFLLHGALQTGATIAASAGHFSRAAVLLGAVDAIHDRTHLAQADQDQYDQVSASIQGSLDPEAFRASWAEGRARSMDDIVGELAAELSSDDP